MAPPMASSFPQQPPLGAAPTSSGSTSANASPSHRHPTDAPGPLSRLEGKRMDRGRARAGFRLTAPLLLDRQTTQSPIIMLTPAPATATPPTPQVRCRVLKENGWTGE
jgi:hypothetical protein